METLLEQQTTEVLQVEDNPDLVKDIHSGSVINTNRTSYASAKKRKANLVEKAAEEQALRDEVRELRALVKEFIGK